MKRRKFTFADLLGKPKANPKAKPKPKFTFDHLKGVLITDEMRAALAPALEADAEREASEALARAIEAINARVL